MLSAARVKITKLKIFIPNKTPNTSEGNKRIFCHKPGTTAYLGRPLENSGNQYGR
jgi:hypothetical protein